MSLKFLDGTRSDRALWSLTAAEAALVTEIGECEDIYCYQHPMPLLATIAGDAALDGYDHPLLALRLIGGDADLRHYGHDLPALAVIGGCADLRHYGYALPALAEIGGAANLEYYQHPLRALNCIGGPARLRGWLQPCAWIEYAGDDERGYSFWFDRLTGFVRAGCRVFTQGEAIQHWGPDGESPRPDCFELVKKIILRSIK